MVSLYYKGKEKVEFDKDNLTFLEKTDSEIFNNVFEQNARVSQEEDEEGNVIFQKRDLTVLEKVTLLIEFGFTYKNDKVKVIESKSLGLPTIEEVIAEITKDLESVSEEIVNGIAKRV